MRKDLLLAVAGVLVVLSGCHHPTPPSENKLVTSNVDGIQLVHRYLIQPPKEFKLLNKQFPALYNASVMSTPGFEGKVVRYLKPGQFYTLLGQVENNWLAIADLESNRLVGYTTRKAFFDTVVVAPPPKPKAKKRPRPKTVKKQCVQLDDGPVCKSATNAPYTM